MKVGAVSVAAGSGRLARRDQAVLFDPSGTSQRLIEGFDAAVDDDAAFDLIKQTLVASELEHAPLVAVRWGTAVDLLIFGDIAIETSAPSTPRLAGGSNETWIEHRIGPMFVVATGSIVVTCGAESADGTNLRLGVAACSGFRVDLAPDHESGSSPDDVSAPVPVEAEWEDDTPVEPDAVWRPPGDTPDTQVNAERAPDDASPVADRVPAPDWDIEEHSSTHDLVDFTDSVFEVAPVPSADSGPEPLAAFDAPLPDRPDFQAPRPSTAEMERFPAPPAEELDASSVDLTESAACSKGHPNPADSSSCFTCGAPVLAPGHEHIGWFDLADGSAVAIEGPMVLGRRPATTDDVAPLVVDHPEVSRSHAQLDLDGWAVVLIDLGSRNGTWISEGGAEPVRLEAGEPHVLVDGCVVLLGATDAAISFRRSG